MSDLTQFLPKKQLSLSPVIQSGSYDPGITQSILDYDVYRVENTDTVNLVKVTFTGNGEYIGQYKVITNVGTSGGNGTAVAVSFPTNPPGTITAAAGGSHKIIVAWWNGQKWATDTDAG